MPEGVIQENELIQLDGTIDKLIEQLEGLNNVYGSTIEVIKQSAEALAKSMKSVSGATKEGRKSIDESALAASRLEAAERDLYIALTDVGQEIAWVKAQTSDVNKATVAQRKQLELATGSYDKLKAELKELTNLYKSLSKEERLDAEFGEQLRNEIKAKTDELKKLDNSIKPVIEKMSLLQKTEKELAYWQSEEGKKVVELRKKIRELTSTRNESTASKSKERSITDEIAQAQERLTQAQDGSLQELYKLNYQTKEATELAKAKARVDAAQEGSYEKLRAEYALASLELRKHKVATEEDIQKQNELIATVAKLRAQLQVFNEATGDYSMSVGRYTNVWTGLGFQVQQVVRELPAAAISLNTFFLAISNNIPMLVDEIKRLKTAGASFISITKNIVKSLFSWQTALVVLLAVFSKFGKQILDFVADIFKADTAINRLNRALKNIKKEIESTNGNYGKNIVTLRKLGNEYKALRTQAEKEDWIKKHKSDWQQLNVAMDGVADADNLFISRTEAVRKAFSQRARAAAAYKFAEDKYAEIVKEEEKRRQVEEKGTSAYRTRYVYREGLEPLEITPQEQYDEDIKKIDKKIAKLEKEADAYFDLGNAADDAAKKILGEYEKEDRTGGKSGRDVTKYIESTKKQVTEKTENAITKMQISEYEKRRKEAIKTYHSEVNALQNTYNENERILNGYYKLKKGLTPEQRKALEDMQNEITSTMKAYKDVYNKTIQDIATDEKIGYAKLAEENLQNTLASVKEGSKAELALRKQSIKNRMQIELLENSKLIKEERKDEKAIKEKYDKEIEDLETAYQARLLEIQMEGLQLRMDANSLSLEQSLKFTIDLINIEEQAAIDANKQLAKELQQSEDDIKAYYKRMRNLAKGSIALAQFNAGQIEETTNIVQSISGGKKAGLKTAVKYGLEGSRKREIYEIDKQIANIEKQIELYREGQLDLSAEELANLELQTAELEAKRRKIKGFSGFIGDVASGGIAGGLLGTMGFDNASIDAFNNVKDQILQNISEIMQAEIDAAQAAVDAAQQRVDAAQSAYEAEIEARNNGYANNVETARRELEQEKKNQQAKQKLLEEAQNRQEAINTITQTSSLITASAQLWSTMSAVPAVGPALAIAAIAAMFTSFAFAKIRAKQAASQRYGEGGLEFLDGGSHASGNDIDLHTRNSKGKNMRAEGGEAMAIINRRNTKRYKAILPDVIDSFNRGTFEDKYLNAFELPSGNIILNSGNDIDLSKIESQLENIYNQNSKRTQVLSNGTTIIYYKNITRISRNS